MESAKKKNKGDINKQITTNFGEFLTALCLDNFINEKKGNKVPIYMVGSSNYEYDLVIPIKVEETFFEENQTVISVKTRSLKVTDDWRWEGAPKINEFEKVKNDIEKLGWGFWLSQVIYDFKNKGLSFTVYLLHSKWLKEDDFKSDKGKLEKLNVKKFIDKAKKYGHVFSSKDFNMDSIK